MMFASLPVYEHMSLIHFCLNSALWRKFRAQLKLDPGNVALYLGKYNILYKTVVSLGSIGGACFGLNEEKKLVLFANVSRKVMICGHFFMCLFFFDWRKISIDRKKKGLVVVV